MCRFGSMVPVSPSQVIGGYPGFHGSVLYRVHHRYLDFMVPVSPFQITGGLRVRLAYYRLLIAIHGIHGSWYW